MHLNSGPRHYYIRCVEKPHIFSLLETGDRKENHSSYYNNIMTQVRSGWIGLSRNGYTLLFTPNYLGKDWIR